MLPNTQCFEVTKRSARPIRSLQGVTGLNAMRGTAFIEDPANPGIAKLADGTLPIAGFITRPAQVGGPTIADAILPNRVELPFADTDYQSFEPAEEVQAEGYGANAILGATVAGQAVVGGAFLYSATGANAGLTITGSTATGTKVSFRNGQFSVAQAEDVAEYYLAQILPPARPDLNTFRCRFVLLTGIANTLI
jgi:hypothetical protein